MDKKLKKSNRKKKIKRNVKRISIMGILMIAILVMSVIIINSKKTEKYVASKTSSDIEDSMEEENKTENELVIETKQVEDTSWDEDAEETKVNMEEEENSNQKNKSTYYIKINYTANCVTIYKKDKSGNYTIPVKAMICSTGKATPTSGVYKMTDKYRWHMLEGGVYGQYCSRITGHILFHSVPYLTNSPDALEYWAYDKLGTKASAGCIRLTVEDAKWIHSNCASGTYVEFYSSSDPGPLGKPSAQKISWNETCRNWDPTDPDSRNPWHTYVAPKEETPNVEEPVTKPQEEPKPEPEVKPEEPDTNTNVNTNTDSNITVEDKQNEIENTTTNSTDTNTIVQQNEIVENEINNINTGGE